MVNASDARGPQTSNKRVWRNWFKEIVCKPNTKKNVYENSRTCVITNIIDNIWDLVEKTYLK